MDDKPTVPTTTAYPHGHHPSILRGHQWRTAENSAGYLLPHLQPWMHILDIGCGPGTITVDLARAVPQGHVTGLERSDIDPSVLAQAMGYAHQQGVSNVTFTQGDGNALEYADETFDVVLCHQVLQHVPDPVGMLKEMHRVTKAGGGIVAAREADLGAAIWYPQDDVMDEWQRLLTKVQLSSGSQPHAGRMVHSWARQAGFSPTEIRYTWSSWCYHTPKEIGWYSGLMAERIVAAGMSTSAVMHGLATPKELERIAAGWRRWGALEDAFFSFPSGEIICRKG
ncbi:putative ubiE/COQ5 methyltransferase [Aspergillus udagawae]|nr:putative ubiE/COQ5 methyltransferase [Aspergillus udagawae]